MHVGPNGPSGTKILLVEDEALIAMHEAKMLGKYGYHVEIAVDGPDAVKKVRDDPKISLMLLDVNLGAGSDISSIVSEIEEIRELPIIILTNYEDKSIIDTIRDITRYGYVLKSSGEHVLVGSIDKALELFKVHQETKRSEKLYRAVLTNISDAVFLTDEAGDFIFICPNLDILFGYSVEEVAAFKNIQNLLGDIVVPAGELDKQLEVANVERQIKDKRGERHTILVNVKRVDIGKGTRLYTCRDITDLRMKEEALRESENKYRDLAAHINMLREEKEQQLARDLHDGIGQEMALLRLQLGRQIKEQECSEGLLEPIILKIDGMIRSLRSIVGNLRPFPLDEVGLQSAIEARLEEFQEETGIILGEIVLPEAVKAPPRILQGIYKIFQEALANIARHSSATEVYVSLSVHNDIPRLTVADNGTGIRGRDVSGTGSFGLLGMFERAELLGGELTVSDRPGGGTEVVLVLPALKT